MYTYHPPPQLEGSPTTLQLTYKKLNPGPPLSSMSGAMPQTLAPNLEPDMEVHAAYLEGQGDLVSRLIMGICRVAIWVIGVINLLTKSP